LWLWPTISISGVCRGEEAGLNLLDRFVTAHGKHGHEVAAAALDQAYKEWNRRPFTAIGYGSVGRSRAIEHLRATAVELQMVATRGAVHIAASEWLLRAATTGHSRTDRHFLKSYR
jgi:hypothetical protein